MDALIDDSDRRINKRIESNDIELVLWTGGWNMESIGSEEHLIREMYNPTDQLVWWKPVCGKTIEFKMEL